MCNAWYASCFVAAPDPENPVSDCQAILISHQLIHEKVSNKVKEVTLH